MVEPVREQLAALPRNPGVYLFRDESDDVLYVGQGEVAAGARAQLLQPGRRPHGHRPDGRADRADRGHRHLVRGGGAAPRAEPRQAPPAAVQRAAARRQVVPVHRRHGGRRVPAGHVHARAPPARHRLLRPVREREEGARDARRAQPRLPVPAVRGAEAGPPLGHPVPRLPHRALHGALHRRDLEGGVPGADRRRDRLPLGRHALDRPLARGADARGGGGGALRGRDPLPQPALRDREPRRAPGRRPARGRHDRRDRPRRRRRPRRGAAVPPPRRQADRPLRLPPRERRGTGSRRRSSRASASSTTPPRRACRRS